MRIKSHPSKTPANHPELFMKKLIQSLILPFNEHLLSACCVPRAKPWDARVPARHQLELGSLLVPNPQLLPWCRKAVTASQDWSHQLGDESPFPSKTQGSFSCTETLPVVSPLCMGLTCHRAFVMHHRPCFQWPFISIRSQNMLVFTAV